MKNFNIIDLHCDTIIESVKHGMDFKSGDGHISIDKLYKGGCLAQCFAIWTPTGGAAQRYGIGTEYYKYFQTAAEFFKKTMADYSDVIRQARTVGEIKKNAAEGKVSALLTIEDSIFVEGIKERVDEAIDLGAVMMGLIWNNDNCMAHPNSRDPEAHMKGLKPFGFETVEHLNEKGVIIDVSHLNEGGYWDVIKTTKKPIAASHSCARALCDHPRNLTDEQLKALGENGGVCGINFYDAFLKEDGSGKTDIADLIRHMVYIKDKAGVGAIALGSDFDGIDSELEFKDYTGMPMIAERLKEAFTEKEIDMICHENFLRVMEDNGR